MTSTTVSTRPPTTRACPSHRPDRAARPARASRRRRQSRGAPGSGECGSPRRPSRRGTRRGEPAGCDWEAMSQSRRDCATPRSQSLPGAAAEYFAYHVLRREVGTTGVRVGDLPVTRQSQMVSGAGGGRVGFRFVADPAEREGGGRREGAGGEKGGRQRGEERRRGRERTGREGEGERGGGRGGGGERRGGEGGEGEGRRGRGRKGGEREGEGEREGVGGREREEGGEGEREREGGEGGERGGKGRGGEGREGGGRERGGRGERGEREKGGGGGREREERRKEEGGGKRQVVAIHLSWSIRDNRGGYGADPRPLWSHGSRNRTPTRNGERRDSGHRARRCHPHLRLGGRGRPDQPGRPAR